MSETKVHDVREELRESPAHAILKDTRAMIWDLDQASKVFSLGFFGKPLGIPKPTGDRVEKPLVLDLLEACYLRDKTLIEVYDPERERELTAEEIIDYASVSYQMFLEKFLTYKDLRDEGFVVTSGMKFGTTFAVYEEGPGIDHSPYIVDVTNPDDTLDSTEVVRAGRLATTVRKRFIVAVPSVETGRVNYLLFKWWKA